MSAKPKVVRSTYDLTGTGQRWVRAKIVESCGSSVHGASFGADDFMERHLGVRFLFPDVANVSQSFANSPDQQWFSLGINDSIVWAPSKWQDDLRTRSLRRHVERPAWVNELVSAVLEDHPGKRFGLLAYHREPRPLHHLRSHAVGRP